MLTDLQNTFTHRLTGKFAKKKSLLNIPSHLKCKAALPCEIYMLKKLHAQVVNVANCCVRLRQSKNS